MLPVPHTGHSTDRVSTVHPGARCRYMYGVGTVLSDSALCVAQRVAEPSVEQTPAGGRDALYRERLAGAADDLDQQHLRSRAMDVAMVIKASLAWSLVVVGCGWEW